MAWRSPSTRILFLVFACALLLRFAYLAELPATYGPADMDASSYDAVGRNIAAGDWLGGTEAQYLTTPVFSYLLAVFYALAGPGALAVRALQLFFGACSVLLIYVAGRWTFGHRVGFVAALFSAAYGPAVFYEGTVGTAGWLIFLTSLALVSLLWAERQGTASAWMFAGVALALLCLLRPNAFVLVPLACVWIVSTCRASGERRARRHLVAYLAGLAILLCPLLLRHVYAARAGHVSSIVGLHFYVGNNPTATGTYVVVPGIRPSLEGHVRDGMRIAERETGRALGPFEVSEYWSARALRFIVSEPRSFVRLLSTKLGLSLSDAEIHIRGHDFESASGSSAVLKLPLLTFGLLCPLALLGLCLTFRRSPQALLVHLFFLGYLVSLCMFFVTGRYRLPLVPPVLLYAAFALVWLQQAWRQRATRRCAAATAVVLALVFVLPGKAQAPAPTSVARNYTSTLYQQPAGCPPRFAGSTESPPPYRDIPIAGTTFTGWWMGARDFHTEAGGMKHWLTIDIWCLLREARVAVEFFKLVSTVEWHTYGQPRDRKQMRAPGAT